MTLSKTTSATLQNYSVDESNVMCAESNMSQANLCEMIYEMSLRHLINKTAIVTTKAQGSTYNKRTFPFDMSNERHVRALNAICEMFCNPWENSDTKRADLTDDIADYFLAHEANELITLTASDYNALVANQKKSKKKKK